MVQFGGRDSSSLNSDHIDIYLCTCTGLYTARHISIQYDVTNLLFLCVCMGSFADFFPSLLISG